MADSGTFVLSEAIGYKALPEDMILEAEIIECGIRDSFFNVDDNDPSLGKRKEVSFKFQIDDARYPEYSGRTIYGSVNALFTQDSNCKLRQWVEEIIGVNDLQEGFQFSTNDLLGGRVKVVVANYTKKDGTVKDKVKDLIRISGYGDASDSF
jgi:hypothetical protein